MIVKIPTTQFGELILSQEGRLHSCTVLLGLVWEATGRTPCMNETNIPAVMLDLYSYVGIEGVIENIGNVFEFQLPAKCRTEYVEMRLKLARDLVQSPGCHITVEVN